MLTDPGCRDIFPGDLTEFEAKLGFDRRWVFGFGGTEDHPEAALVTARILSGADIVLKTLDAKGMVCYAHYRWGYAAGLAAESRFICWWPMGRYEPFAVTEFIRLFDAEKVKPLITPITGLRFNSYQK